MTPAALSGLDLLATAVVLVDAGLAVRYVNPAAENLFEASIKNVMGESLDKLFSDSAVLMAAIQYARANNCSYTEHDLELGMSRHARLHLSCTVTPVEISGGDPKAEELLLEFRHIQQQLRIAREERMLDQSQANRTLIRNLAHEIRNPLGGIRGAAQLLDRELERPNLHEVLERVRSLILAEYGNEVVILCDYDVSLPLLKGDKEQLIQATLNVVRNAAQAITGSERRGGEITLRTRVVRQVTLARRRYRHALALEIADDGPGIPEALQERIFNPLVSGREGGSGLGLTLAQNFITQHHGMIYFESVPGDTTFTILLPAEEAENGK